MTTTTIAAWTLAANNGVDPSAVASFSAGFGLVVLVAGSVLLAIVGISLIRRLLRIIGYDV